MYVCLTRNKKHIKCEKENDKYYIELTKRESFRIVCIRSIHYYTEIGY